MRAVLSLLPGQAPQPKGVNADGVVTFLASKIAPILLAVLGVVIIGQAAKGRMAKTLTMSSIALIGLLFIAGAASLFYFGEFLVELMFGR